MKSENLTNNEILRKIQDLTDDHEKLKVEIINKCRNMDDCEKEYNKLIELLNERMGKK